MDSPFVGFAVDTAVTWGLFCGLGFLVAFWSRFGVHFAVHFTVRNKLRSGDQDSAFNQCGAPWTAFWQLWENPHPKCRLSKARFTEISLRCPLVWAYF
jgi:hypothetical protein